MSEHDHELPDDFDPEWLWEQPSYDRAEQDLFERLIEPLTRAVEAASAFVDEVYSEEFGFTPDGEIETLPELPEFAPEDFGVVDLPEHESVLYSDPEPYEPIANLHPTLAQSDFWMRQIAQRLDGYGVDDELEHVPNLARISEASAAAEDWAVDQAVDDIHYSMSDDGESMVENNLGYRIFGRVTHWKMTGDWQRTIAEVIVEDSYRTYSSGVLQQVVYRKLDLLRSETQDDFDDYKSAFHVGKNGPQKD